GAVMNYRLVPDAAWPSGGEDVAAAVGWLRANIAHYGGDPARIILMGTSAGAVHLGTWLMHAQTSKKLEGVNGIILLSGLYGYTPLDERDTPYYGAQADYTSRMPCAAIEHTQLPLFIARAEYDPPRFQTEFDAMVADRTRHPILPTTKFVAAGHNHYSIALHIGTGEIDGDHALSDALRGFIAPLVR
ncbi:MAG: alpha/beta hydrolase, partial [Alphaproteobacteria bacterium]|nr:alpha/beta hydrolase [Alphaproteobacteria bacterium]